MLRYFLLPNLRNVVTFDRCVLPVIPCGVRWVTTDTQITQHFPTIWTTDTSERKENAKRNVMSN